MIETVNYLNPVRYFPNEYSEKYHQENGVQTFIINNDKIIAIKVIGCPGDLQNNGCIAHTGLHYYKTDSQIQRQGDIKFVVSTFGRVTAMFNGSTKSGKFEGQARLNGSEIGKLDHITIRDGVINIQSALPSELLKKLPDRETAPKIANEGITILLTTLFCDGLKLIQKGALNVSSPSTAGL